MMKNLFKNKTFLNLVSLKIKVTCTEKKIYNQKKSLKLKKLSIPKSFIFFN